MKKRPFRLAYRLAWDGYTCSKTSTGGFTARLPVDENGIVLDYPDLLRRVT